MSDVERFDIFVIGGGINGCGIARDAAGRGYSVCLAEMNDLASGTSSGATKLIHGGLRYLEYYEFRLVREALFERERLWSIAPHIIWPLRFVLPIHSGLRPAWLLRLGLFIYDHLGGRKLLPPARTLDMSRDEVGRPLKPLYTRAFEYSDAWVNDARLVVLNARDAADNGAQIMVRTRVVSARHKGDYWEVKVEAAFGEVQTIEARALINAAGPWVDNILADVVGEDDGKSVRLVQGSHIVVRKLFDHDRCYIFQNADGRIIFAIPYEEDFTLIGTTDRDYDGDPGEVKASEEEISYLCDAASEYFINPIVPDDVVWSYSAVRPLMGDGGSKAQEATRDYVLTLLQGNGGAPLLNIHGGKLTTYRKLAEAALDKISGFIGNKGEEWTATKPLPGGDFSVTGFADLVAKLRARYTFLGARHARRLTRLYGTRAFEVLGEAAALEDLGTLFGDDLYQAEVDYLVATEWAVSVEDVLWRRTKRGLWLSGDETKRLEAYLKEIQANSQTRAAE
ncbi:MAG TPA: glycerol-3-phosphate dehydrogenase [Devosia sp.]|nr:glycerol-3-phosphate dehydrogenase [Devosia sp.]